MWPRDAEVFKKRSETERFHTYDVVLVIYSLTALVWDHLISDLEVTNIQVFYIYETQ